MENRVKRFLSLVLALVLVLSCVPVAMAEETNVAATLPTATVTEIQNEDLTLALNFVADEVTEEQLAYYGDWHADFILTVNKDVTFNANGGADGYLSGQYDEWSENWVSVPFEDVTLKANTPLQIMAYAAESLDEPGLRYTYREVYDVVKDFDCGVYFTPEFLEANPDLEVTLELRMFTPNNEDISYVIGKTYSFKNDFVAQNTATEKLYKDVSEATMDAETGETVILLKDAEDSFVTVIDKSKLDLNGHVLAAAYVTCYGDIIDSSEDNSGVLKVNASRFLIQNSNEQLPVKTGEGYKFVEVLNFNHKIKEGPKFIFQPLFEEAAHALLQEGADITGVTINVRVSWEQKNGIRTQNFVYKDEHVIGFVGSYDAAIGKYGKQFQLTLKGAEDIEGLTFAVVVASDTGVEFSSADEEKDEENTGDGETSNVTVKDNMVAEEVTISNEQASAVVPEGTLLEKNTTNLTLTVAEVEQSQSNIALGENEEQKSVDVHIEGISADNTVPMIITLQAFAEPGLNEGNLQLYHVEDGKTVAMTQVATLEEVDAHNEFCYDPVTGDVTMALATFSEVTSVSDTENAWNGNYDYSWYTNAAAPIDGESASDYVIANADQLAAFGAIVGGMNGQTQNSFVGKTVKLLADINLGDKDNANNELIFHPIGYYYTDDKNADGTTGDYYSTVNAFEGTFDGNGHTIANFYHNTWEIKGDYDANYYNDAMGLFGYVVNGTVKNLTVENFSSDGEFAPTGVIAAYAVNSTFENIAITNCNPRVYNTGNGGIVGIGGNSDDPDTYKLTFNNITIDNSNIISALWGSWDVACGGLVGMFRGAGHVYMTNCHVAAQIDVYNDVCGNYQYYWYRYSGMMVGTNKNTTTDADGYTVPETAKFHAENCTVHFGEWNDYYYCELVANSLASYTHDHQFSRLEQIQNVTEIQDENGNWNRTGNFILMDGKTPTNTCYHIMKDANGNLYEHKHDKADATNPEINEVVNGQTVLKENNQRIYLPFNQLFTGYGWGVKHIPVYYGEDYAFDGITVLDREVADSVIKFDKADTAKDCYTKDTAVKIGDLFKAATIEDEKLTIQGDKVQVFVSPADADSTAGGTYTANSADWTQGTLTFSGTGAATITITDYYFCTPTTINIKVTEKTEVEKFDKKFTGDFLYRVGNANTVKLGSLFAAKDGAKIGTVSVNVEALNGTAASGSYTSNDTWSNGTIQFTGTGVVKVTITDNDYCTPTELILEVVEATNHADTNAPSATSNSVVLLNNVSGSFSVSGGHTVYGNDFTVTLPATVQSKYSAGYVGYVTMSGGNLDNVRVVGPKYTIRNVFRDQAKDTSDETKANYFYNSILINGGNNTISNSFVSGSRAAICIRGGNVVTIDNSVISGGAVANIEIAGASAVTLKNLTTVQTGDTESRGMGVYVTSGVVELYIEGELVQHNWVNKLEWDEIVPATYKSAFPEFFSNNKYSKYWHYLNGGTDPYVNVAFIFGCNWDTGKIHDERSNVAYETTDATLNGVAGGVYSKVNTVGGNAITDSSLQDPGYTSPGYNPVAPVFNFDNSANDDADDENDAADTYCVYDEATGILKIGITGDSKSLDLSDISVTKDGTTLLHDTYLNGTAINGDSVTIKAADGAKQTLAFKATSNDAGYDKAGNPIDGSIEYSWTVTVEVATLSYPAPVWNMGGDYQFDTSNCYYAYYSTSQGYGEAVPIYEGIKVNYYNNSGTLVNLDLSETTTLPTGSNNSNSNAFTYTLTDGSTLTMKFSSGWKSGATTHQFTTYNNKVYIYPQSLDNDNYVRAKTTNQDFDVKITYTFTDPNGQSTAAQTMQWYNAKASNGSVSTVQWKTFDSTNGKKPSTCFTPDTLITLADGTQKRIDAISGNELLLVWDFYKGEYATVPASILVNHGRGIFTVASMHFSDGTTVKTINGHGFFHEESNKFVILNENNAADYIGDTFLKQVGNDFIPVTLVDVTIEEKEEESWGILTAKHYNCFLEGMLTMTDAEVSGTPNYLMPFEIGEGMKYDEAKLQADIEAYGLYTYEDFETLCTYEQFVGFGLDIFKVSVAKGYITWEGICYMLSLYG